jgi:hypothetical protein
MSEGFLISHYELGSLHCPIRLVLSIPESEHNANVYQDADGKHYVIADSLEVKSEGIQGEIDGDWIHFKIASDETEVYIDGKPSKIK